MVEYYFDADKNALLKKERGISFEEIILLIDEGYLLDVVEHHNKRKYPHQKYYVIDVNGYIHLVPFVRAEDKIFLKTIYPSRKATRDFMKQGGKRHESDEG